MDNSLLSVTVPDRDGSNVKESEAEDERLALNEPLRVTLRVSDTSDESLTVPVNSRLLLRVGVDV